MKNTLILICLLFTVYCKSQTVKLFEIQDTIWYSMDKKAAQKLIYNANKGLYFDQYVSYRDKMLNQVIAAKINSDSTQIILQQDLGRCKYYLLKSEEDKVILANNKYKLDNANKRLKNQRNILVVITAVATIITGLSL